MKSKYIAILLLLFGLIVLGIWYSKRVEPTQSAKSKPATTSPVPVVSNHRQTNDVIKASQSKPIVKNGLIQPVNPSQKPLSHEEERSNYLERFMKELLKPIDCYGKAVDEQGNPIEGAKVNYTANNNPDPTSSGSEGETVTDTNGLFSISTHGMGIFVKVSKEGYYQASEINGQRGSFGSFVNYDNRGKTDVPMPSKNIPAIFVLKKKGEAASLIHVPLFSALVPKDGTLVEVDLTSGRIVSSGSSSLQIEVWTEDQAKDGNGHYNWKCLISIPNGGLVQRGDEYDFEAPVEGYESSIEISMSSTSERWRPGFQQEFFAKFSDGHFARFYFNLATRGSHSFEIESFINPTPGSRNLEFDPAKQIR